MKKKILAAALFLTMAILVISRWNDLPVLIDTLRENVQTNPYQSMTLFIGLFLLVTITSLPGAALLTTSSGFLFGFWQGVLLSAISLGLSAVLSFLVARYFLRSWVEKHFVKIIRELNKDIDANGLTHLFLIRMIPGIPFPLLNMSYGVTKIKLLPYWWVSQIALLPITLLLVNAGASLESVTSPVDVFTPKIVLSLLAIGAFPIVIKKSFLSKKAVNKSPVNSPQ